MVELSDWQYFTCPSCSKLSRMEVLAFLNDGSCVSCEFCGEDVQIVMLTRKVLAINQLQAVRAFIQRVHDRASTILDDLPDAVMMALWEELDEMELSEKE